MDIPVFVIFLGSMLIVYFLARERGWNRPRWTAAASIIGPLAIPLIYLMDVAWAIRKKIHGQRP